MAVALHAAALYQLSRVDAGPTSLTVARLAIACSRRVRWRRVRRQTQSEALARPAARPVCGPQLLLALGSRRRRRASRGAQTREAIARVAAQIALADPTRQLLPE